MIDQIEDCLGYRFKDESLLTEALTHASIAGDRLQSNERLEFLGDAILGFVVCEYLFKNFPELLEGELTKIKSSVVSRRVCAKVSLKLKLAEMLNLGKGMAGRGNLPSSIAAAVLESIIGAIYLDGGLEPASRFIIETMQEYIDEAANSAHQHNFKSVLQQHAQKHLPANPSYALLDEKGPDHAKCFEVCVELAGRRFSSAWANSKKEAEQKAALLALNELGLADIDEEGHVGMLDTDSDASVESTAS
ncbi:ribonuclease III [Phycisphaerales bacterium AB-hyl4]|uniref:Ribonuclease 3 n=1 Tax=Natronomicrosphaera hydrolytica TaxID=3242702 RepID=A0ABV4U669_9BACT